MSVANKKGEADFQLEILVDGCRFDLDLTIYRKTQTKVLSIRIDGCMHPLPTTDECSCTHPTHSNESPQMEKWQCETFPTWCQLWHWSDPRNCCYWHYCFQWTFFFLFFLFFSCLHFFVAKSRLTRVRSHGLTLCDVGKELALLLWFRMCQLVELCRITACQNGIRSKKYLTVQEDFFLFLFLFVSFSCLRSPKS